MPDNYTVADNEWLLKIANDNGFRTEEPLVAANPVLPQVCSSNYDVLAPGTSLVIPDVTPKQVPAAACQRHVFQARQTLKDLVITPQAADGTMIVSGRWTLTPSPSGSPKKGNLGGDAIRFEQWPPDATEADLELVLTVERRRPNSQPDEPPDAFTLSEKIRLHVGGLDPLTGSEQDRSRAAQKILANLGLYGGPIDGDLATSRSRAAIHKFRANHGIKSSDDLLDADTVSALLDQQQGRIANSHDRFQTQTRDRDAPLQLGAEAAQREERFTSLFSRYVDPREERTERKFGALRFFPETAYVALSDAATCQNPNVIRMKSRKFIFVDNGRWCKAGRDFSVIYGRHVYLCEFVRDPGTAAPAPLPPGDEQRLDRIFFKGMGAHVKVNFYASAQWALEDEFDWTRLIVTIPDLHLMNIRNGQIFRGATFKLDPELDLLLFVKRLLELAPRLPGLQIVQLGDSFDLWVGCEPRLFKKNGDLLVDLYQGRDQRWTCGSSSCGGHDRPDAECPAGVWKCRNFDCPGHLRPREPCPSIARWTCGRTVPPCSGHSNSIEVCDTRRGSLWMCNKTEPPCPGHDAPKTVRPGRVLGVCPETLDALAQIVEWIGDIRGVNGGWVGEALKMRDSMPPGIDIEKDLALGDGKYLNPSCAALDLLEKNFELTYLHGNHDNYLILIRVTRQAGIARRNRYFETDGVLIEHGHRLESRLIGSGDPCPTNYDGSITGYEATLQQYHDQDRRIRAERLDTAWYDQAGQWWKQVWLNGKENFADWAAQQFQQTQYMEEYAQVWVGRASLKTYPPPHIFGIGHTHDPLLQYINIVFN